MTGRDAHRPDALLDDASTTPEDDPRHDEPVPVSPGVAGLSRGGAAIADKLQPERASETQEALERATESETRRKE